MKNHYSIIALLYAAISLASPSQRSGLKVHEWGTFTSMQGSNGETLTGLEFEEEALPSFVHNRNPLIEESSIGSSLLLCQGCPGRCCKGECCDNLTTASDDTLAVTQKMETPVLYFYSQKPMKVDVTVDFPNGIISQYYPKPTSFLPALGGTQGLKGGQIHYEKLEVLTEPALIPPVAAGNVYGPARKTTANFIRAQDEAEKFIFYRGLGNFTTSLRVTSDDRNIKLQNTSSHTIPFALALNIQNGKGAFQELGTLAKNSQETTNLKEWIASLKPTEDLTTFEAKVGPVLVTALVNSGLTREESQAMVNTWRLSYFHNEGMRVLYILPRPETDQILPIRISPQPDELVRTLVGRVEILTTQEERDLLGAALKATSGDSNRFLTLASGRFKEPKLRRISQLNSDKAFQSFINEQLN